MRTPPILSCQLLLLLFAEPTLAKPAPTIQWRALQSGVEYGAVSARGAAEVQHPVRDNRLHIIRVDPEKAKLVALVGSQLRKKARTAKQWVDEHRLIAAINLGMYQADLRTHVGYLRSGAHTNSRRWLKAYKSALAFGPKPSAAAPLVFADLSADFDRAIFEKYAVVTQNLRLIRSDDGKKGRGVWSKQAKRWSEAAVAVDHKGRLLLLFTRVPLSMWEFNRFVLSLPLGVIRAMHMEGGPEASLSIRARGLRLDLCGSFETGFFASDSNNEQWPLPNILGVMKQATSRP